MKRILITFLLLLPVLTTFAQFDFTFITTQWDSSYYDRYFTKWSVQAIPSPRTRIFLSSTASAMNGLITNPTAGRPWGWVLRTETIHSMWA